MCSACDGFLIPDFANKIPNLNAIHGDSIFLPSLTGTIKRINDVLLMSDR
jgi:hypothetical protein